MNINIIKLRESLKRDVLKTIGIYESKYNIPVFLTRAVVEEIINEIKSAEMQELLKGCEENERKKENKPTERAENDN